MNKTSITQSLLCALLLLVASPLFSQKLPSEVRFPSGDTLAWRMSMSARTQGIDPEAGDEVDMIAGTDFSLRLYDAQSHEGRTLAQGRITGQTSYIRPLTENHPEDVRDTSFSSAGQGIELFPLTFYFTPLGELQEVTLTDDEPITEQTEEAYMEATASLEKFSDLFKTTFMGLRFDGTPGVGDEWQMIEDDTTETHGLVFVVHTVTSWRYDRLFDTLGHHVAALTYSADSVSMRGLDGELPEFMKMSMPSNRSHGTFYFDLTSGLPIYASGHTVMEMTFDMGSMMGGDDEEMEEPSDRPKAFTMKMTMRTEAVIE